MAKRKVDIDLDYKGLEQCPEGIGRSSQREEYGLEHLSERYRSFREQGMEPAEDMEALTRSTAELTSKEVPMWEFAAARPWYCRSAREMEEQLRGPGIRRLYGKIPYLADQGLYDDYISKHYGREEIEEAEGFLDDERNKLFTYTRLDLLLKRCMTQDHDHHPLGTPQEMYLGIAPHPAIREDKACKIRWACRLCDMFSRVQVTMATPTLSNARKPYHQLSSCLIDTVLGSPEGIYGSMDDFVQVSKFGGDMSLYSGKVGATRSRIWGSGGAAGGVIHWIRLVDDTAVAADQLGIRQGAAAVCLDAWHEDLPELLQLRTNSGGDRMKAHGIFLTVYPPDLFQRMAKENLDQDWHLMCPYEIQTIEEYCLEDRYGELWEERYLDYVEGDRISERTMLLKGMTRLIIKSAVETSAPFIFNRDTVGRANPNSYRGIMYCSNLCTEITQNMSPVESVSTQMLEVNGETAVVQTIRLGDLVVCNLTSFYLGAINMDGPDKVEYIVTSAVRALDNVIDLNFYPLVYAGITNQNYRGIGLGISGYHHMLTRYGTWWESGEHLVFADRVFRRIHYVAAGTGASLAAEKGRYRYFEGSEWQTGAYFEERGFMSGEWKSLTERAARYGMHNACLLAVAPTNNTSMFSGTTAGLDPVMKRFYLEEKKDTVLPRVASNPTLRTFWLHKNGYIADQIWTVRAIGVRQRRINQVQSVNPYTANDYTIRQLLNLYILAWESGVKALHYVRSKPLEVEEYESCSS